MNDNEKSLKRVVAILAPPYAGKGTLCAALAETDGYMHISTGNMLRTRRERGQVSTEDCAIMDAGGLLSDETLAEMVEATLKDVSGDIETVLLDGYPRTAPQARRLFELTKRLGIALEYLQLYVSIDNLSKRFRQRALDATREDDKNPSVAAQRISLHERNMYQLGSELHHQVLSRGTDRCSSVKHWYIDGNVSPLLVKMQAKVALGMNLADVIQELKN
jgi:adenylate kinase